MIKFLLQPPLFEKSYFFANRVRYKKVLSISSNGFSLLIRSSWENLDLSIHMRMSYNGGNNNGCLS